MDYRARSEARRRSCKALEPSSLALLVLWASLGGCNVDKLVSSESDAPQPGVAAALEFTQLPSVVTAGASISPAPEVTVRDGFGEIVTTFNGEITLELAANPGNATLSGNTTRAAVAGVARFPQLSISRPGEGYRLSAAAPDLKRTTTPGFNVLVRPGFTLAAASGDGQSDTVAARLPKPYVVRVLNSIGEPVAGATVQWSVTSGDGSVSAASSITNSDGLATTVHTLGRTASAQRVTATLSGLVGSPATFTSTARPGAVARIVFAQQPTDTKKGKDIKPPVVVTLVDRFGNRATHYSADVVITITPGAGHARAKLSGTTNRNASAGTASFSNLQIDREDDGYRLRARAGNVYADSAPFEIGD
jgi:hypothetical protein